MIVHRDKAYPAGKVLVDRLRGIIPRQLFDVPIQASIGSRIIARETIKARRKDVLAKCYGGDVTRKRRVAEEAEEGQEADEAGRLGRGAPGGVPGRALPRRREVADAGRGHRAHGVGALRPRHESRSSPGRSCTSTERPGTSRAGGGGMTARALPGLGAEPSQVLHGARRRRRARAPAERQLRGRWARRLVAGVAPGATQSRVLGVIDPDGERTLFILGANDASDARRSAAVGRARGFDAAFFTGEDPRTLVAARRARVLVVTARRLGSLIESGVQADVLIGSASDPGEQFRRRRPARAAPRDRAHRGRRRRRRYRTDSGAAGALSRRPPLPGPRRRHLRRRAT